MDSAMALTRNEWIKAGATPRLVIVQDPEIALAQVKEALTVVKGYRLHGDAIAQVSRSSP
jgi:hypothetical protein